MTKPLKKERFYSLDVFRGATIALMIMVNNPGTWSHIYAPLKHADWHGITPTDLVFPFFLFAVGNAFAFVMPRLEAAGQAAFWKKIIKRSILIFVIGFLLNWVPFLMWQDNQLVFKPWEYTDASGNIIGIRTLGVLQRIAIAYFFASVLIYFFKVKGSFIAACLIMLGYWGLTYFMNPGDPYSLAGWFGTDIDKAILGEAHMYKGEILNGVRVAFDPEGLVSSIGSIAQIILGYTCGYYIIEKGKTHQMVNWVFIVGTLMMFVGYCWDLVFPFNKKIWTSSYVVETTGLAMVIIGVMIYFMEIKGKKNWWLAKFFDAFGKNPLFIFVLSGFLPRVLSLIRIPNGVNADGNQMFITPFGWFYEFICQPIFGENFKASSLFYAICMITFYWLIAWWMDKKKIYIKV